MKRKIYYFLIRLANKFHTPEFYDFGEEIVATQVYREILLVATRNSIYRKNKTNDKWEIISNNIKG